MMITNLYSNDQDHCPTNHSSVERVSISGFKTGISIPKDALICIVDSTLNGSDTGLEISGQVVSHLTWKAGNDQRWPRHIRLPWPWLGPMPGLSGGSGSGRGARGSSSARGRHGSSGDEMMRWTCAVLIAATAFAAGARAQDTQAWQEIAEALKVALTETDQQCRSWGTQEQQDECEAKLMGCTESTRTDPMLPPA